MSFFVGGLFIALQTLIAERLPVNWRRIILTLPSTLAVGLFFIGLTKSATDASQTTIVIPGAIAGSYIYAACFTFFSKKGIIPAISISTILWFIYSAIILKFPPANFTTSVFLYALPVIVASYLLIKTPSKKIEFKQFPINTKQLILRGIFAGSIILTVTLLAKTVGNIWGGIFSTFPASFTSTFIIYYHLQGKQCIPALTKSLFFPGSIALLLYIYIVKISFPEFGIWIGTIVSYAVTILFFLTYEKVSRNFNRA